MAILTSPPVFGFESEKCYSSLYDLPYGSPETMIRYHNLAKIGGYVPVIGFFTGALRIELFVRKGGVENRMFHLIRAIFEILGLGILFLVPDIVVTTVRHIAVCLKKDDNFLSSIENY